MDVSPNAPKNNDGAALGDNTPYRLSHNNQLLPREYNWLISHQSALLN